jgi:hypothetical protein
MEDRCRHGWELCASAEERLVIVGDGGGGAQVTVSQRVASCDSQPGAILGLCGRSLACDRVPGVVIPPPFPIGRRGGRDPSGETLPLGVRATLSSSSAWQGANARRLSQSVLVMIPCPVMNNRPEPGSRTFSTGSCHGGMLSIMNRRAQLSDVLISR